MTGGLRHPAEHRGAAAGVASSLRRHWLAAILLTAGLVLRIGAQVAYRPALLYVDTLKYLYNAYPGADPVGYKVPLRLILLVGNLSVVAAIQHLLGLAIAVTLYLVLLRRGTPRWLAALAIAPILLDAYQLQIEQTIMPDVWFEALIVVAIVALLAVRADGMAAAPAAAPIAGEPGSRGGPAMATGPESPSVTAAATAAVDTRPATATATAAAGTRPATATTASDASASDGPPAALAAAGDGPPAALAAAHWAAAVARLWRALTGSAMSAVIVAGLILGACATVRQVGEILILPALLFLVALGGGRERLVTRAFVLFAAFIVPIFGYSAGSYLIAGQFGLASATPSISSYGRMAVAADCATLKLPTYEGALCPTARQRAFGEDWLDHDIASPLKSFVAPAGMNRYAIVASFNRAVVEQQPQRVLSAITSDTIKLFALTRTSSQGGTPISRWQFQDFYPTYPTWITIRHGIIFVGLPRTHGPVNYQPLAAGYGGAPQVDKPIAAALRRYQLDGGYTPGPAMLIFALAGLAGSLLVLARRSPPARRRLTLACLLFFGSGAALLLMSDVFQFSWRYQLPALVTLPPAGALGIAAVLSYRFSRSPRSPAGEQRDELPELASPAV